MKRLPFFIFAILIAAVSTVGSPVLASDDDRRLLVTRDADYFGGDYDIAKDVSLEACQEACLADKRCLALTYNVLAGWCFLKESVGELRRVEGAVSAQIADGPPAETAIDRSARRAELTFLSTGDFDTAQQLADDLARRPLHTRSASELVAEGRQALKDERPRAAVEAFSDALRHDPESASHWDDLLRALYAVNTGSWEEQRQRERRRLATAINLYLLAVTDAERADALIWIGGTLVDIRDWKPAIRAYRASLALREHDKTRTYYEQLIAERGFRLLEHRVDSDTASPRICLVFSHDLDAGSEAMADFVRVADDTTLAISASGREICIDGVVHGGRYDVAVRKGLPATDGEVIEKSIALDIFVRDRQPSVRFPGMAYVLPGNNDGAIPVATVNTAVIKASLYRVGDRSLARAIGDRQFMQQMNAYQGDRLAEETGELVWSGEVDVEQSLNAEVMNAIPVRDLIDKVRPGAYVLVASASNHARDWEARATQWFIVTDLGLTTYAGADGFHVTVRSLASAAPREGVEVRLVAVNNEILASATTDAHGRAAFDPGLVRGLGGMAPALLVAETEAGDYSFLDLTRATIDLTDRGVAGRTPPGPLDVYLTTERGIYRPGETVVATALVRDAQANAAGDLPLTMKVRRPDGKDAETRLIDDLQAGGTVRRFDVAGDAMRGAWQLGVYADPDGDPLAEVSFLVEDFLPERLDFDLTAEMADVRPGGRIPLSLTARYLYGAPASNLEVSGRVSLQPERSLDGYPGFVFGLADERDQPVSQPFGGMATDAEGRLAAEVDLPDVGTATRPLRAAITAQVLDANGRPVERTESIAVADRASRLGLKPRFDGSASENTTVGFDVVALNADADASAPVGGEWTLERIEVDFQWYRTNGRWNYRTVDRKRRVAAGAFALNTDARAALDVDVEWGEYELTVTSGREVLPASYRFEAGWRTEAASLDTPETLRVALDRESYALGDTVAVHVTAPFAGRAEIVVADNRVIEATTADIPADGATVELTVDESWGPGAYILVSVFRPMDLAAGRMPARAMGLAWATVDPGDRRLAVAIDAPETARPRQSVPVTVSVGEAAAGAETHIVLAAVDAGILNLTGHEAPDPDGWYFGQRRLGLTIRDFYNQLIDRTQGVAGRVRSGGDASLMRFDGPPPPDTLMAYHSDVVTVGEDGQATFEVPVPDFNGTVRLMAMAWTTAGVGHATGEIVLRDPVVMATSAPRFLAPGDRSRLLVELDNVEKLDGEATLQITSEDDVLSVADIASSRTIDLASFARHQILVPVEAMRSGVGELHVALTLADGTRLDKSLPLEVRNNEPPSVLVSEFALSPGASVTLDEALGAAFLPDTWSATVSVSGAGRLDVAGIVRSLDLYPYGCTEQITSRALPLVYLDDVVTSAGLDGDPDVAARVSEAITRVVARQNGGGGFGLWSPDDGSDLWLDAYVTDFLSRARGEGFEVPATPFRLALDNLKNQLAYVGDFERGGEAIAYALYVLARHGEAAIGDLRYYGTARLENLATPMAKAHIAAGLALYGDTISAARVFASARAQLTRDENGAGRVDFGSPTRDSAAVLTLVSETGGAAAELPQLGEILATAWSRPGRQSTQEQAWSLLAAHNLMRGAERPRLAVDGVGHDGPLFANFNPGNGDDAMTIENRSERPHLVTVTSRGIAEAPESAGGSFATLTRAYYDVATGAPVDLAAIEQGQRLVVVLSVLFGEGVEGSMVIDDPLPAGLEIDNPSILRSGDIGGLDWLDLRSRTRSAEFRADRFVAAFDLGAKDAPRQNFAYVARAVSPGAFAHPAALVEDMYQPERHARTASGRMTVVGPLR